MGELYMEGCGTLEWADVAGVKADDSDGMVATLGVVVAVVLLPPKGRAVLLHAGLG